MENNDKARAQAEPEEEKGPAMDLTKEPFPSVWRAMGELKVVCLGLPFSCGFF